MLYFITQPSVVPTESNTAENCTYVLHACLANRISHHLQLSSSISPDAASVAFINEINFGGRVYLASAIRWLAYVMSCRC